MTDDTTNLDSFDVPDDAGLAAHPITARRLEKLEEIAAGFKGVQKSFAIQAGREIRVIVDSKRLSDEKATWLSRDIAQKVENELTYPGQIKVTVIRETRSIEYAK